MQMRMTYLPTEHTDQAPGSSVSADAFDPNAGVIITELNSHLYNKHLNDMVAQGWQLISVQPVHRIEYTHIQNVSVIGGFYFFWQTAAAASESLAFPMTSLSFPGLPVTNPAKAPHTSRQKVTVSPSKKQSVTPINNDDITTAEKNDLPEKGSNEIDNKEREEEQRISSIKQLLQDNKKAASVTESKPGSRKADVVIPPEANTQLRRNIEDLHNIRSVKTPPTQEQKSIDDLACMGNSSDPDDDLDLDLDLDFDDLCNPGNQ